MSEEPEVVVEEPEERNFDDEARKEGWVPEEEWNGPKEKWVDSATFVERGEKIAGILKSKVSRLEEEVQRLAESNKQFGAFHKTSLEKEQKKAAQAIKELEQLRKQAISEGDGDAFDAADRQLSELKREAPQTDQTAHAQMAQQWLAENKWYNESPKLGPYADGIAERVAAEGYSGKAYFNELTRRTKEAFPEEFSNTRRTQSSAVEGGGEKETKNSKAKTYDNLPSDAKAACANFVRGGFMTKEEYVKQYDWE